MTADPPRMAVLTPPGRGAIAVVRLWGPQALATADAAFRPARGNRLAETPARRPRFGRLGAGLGDEVVVAAFDGDPPGVEIQCHGGSAAVEMVLAALEAEGARRVESVEYLEAVEPSSLRGQAWDDLSRATTLRTSEILLEQAQGALDREIDGLLADLAAEPDGTAARLADLVERGRRVGLRLVDGWRAVIAGRPNVGKSRLLNALAGYSRAIVSPTPGTTRDAVTVRTAFDGWPVELVDTAGVRESDDSVERSGVERALRERARADLVLHVLDGSRPLDEGEAAFPDRRSIVVVSKADLAAAWDPGVVLKGRPHVVVSAEEGTGLDDLATRIAQSLVPAPPQAGAGVPFRAEQVAELASAGEALAVGEPGRATEVLRGLLAGLRA